MQYQSSQTYFKFIKDLMRNTHIGGMHKSYIEFEQLKQLEDIKNKTHSSPVGQLCSICSEQTIKSFCKSIFTCGHKDICLNCFHQYAYHCLQQKNLPKCVTHKCVGVIKLDDSEVMSLLTTSLGNKIKQAAGNLKNNKKCTVADCYGFINNGTCDLCLTNFCQNCWGKQHRGNCDNPQTILPQNIKICPKCGEGIQKDGGCLHIKCKCKHEFCFKCLKNWSKIHHTTCGTGDSSILDWILDAFRGN